MSHDNMYPVPCPFCGKETDEVEVCSVCNDRLLRGLCITCGGVAGDDPVCDGCKNRQDLDNFEHEYELGCQCDKCGRLYAQFDEAARCPCD